MTHRHSIAAFVLAAIAAVRCVPRANAQSPTILPFHVPTAVNVERVLGLKYGTNQSGNGARLNAGLLASASTYRGPWCFNGGGTVGPSWAARSTLEEPPITSNW